MILGPPVWATGSWGNTDVWEDGTWGLADQPAIFGDLTTLFHYYTEALRDANPTKVDTNTLVRNDLATVIASKSSYVDDYNTMYTAHLS